MTEVIYSERALADLDRLLEFLALRDPREAQGALELISDAVRVLERHPDIGRPARGDLRELVISHGRKGYVALYRVTPGRRRAEILAVRHQKEAGFA
jgi:plasmid stabilization system protein ParE